MCRNNVVSQQGEETIIIVARLDGWVLVLGGARCRCAVRSLDFVATSADQRNTSTHNGLQATTLSRTQTLSPAHIKRKSQCDQTTLHLAPLITPVVSRPAATTLIVPTPSVSQQTILNEDKPLTSTFPCCTLPKHSQLQVRCRLNKVLQVL